MGDIYFLLTNLEINLRTWVSLKMFVSELVLYNIFLLLMEENMPN